MCRLSINKITTSCTHLAAIIIIVRIVRSHAETTGIQSYLLQVRSLHARFISHGRKDYYTKWALIFFIIPIAHVILPQLPTVPESPGQSRKFGPSTMTSQNLQASQRKDDHFRSNRTCSPLWEQFLAKYAHTYHPSSKLALMRSPLITGAWRVN